MELQKILEFVGVGRGGGEGGWGGGGGGGVGWEGVGWGAGGGGDVDGEEGRALSGILSRNPCPHVCFWALEVHEMKRLE